MTASAQPPATPRGPRPVAAFFLSLAGSALVLGFLLLSDGRVFELKKARQDARELDRQIAVLRQENQRLRAAIEGARRQEFPAERVAREELHLVHPEDLVLLYPPGSLSPRQPAQETGVAQPNAARPGLSPSPPPR